ncbi:MAG TPA: hypothetical protein PKY78_07370 [Candidatus Omnitrophota bacterium]|nr:hypothetical protein [Candidatus Omnitrophota bacterium]HPS20787.1 hypothetical protein [Candidatus Omnitrophota bacterium]
MKLRDLVFVGLSILSGVSCDAAAQDKMVYNCSRYIHNWGIPEWSGEKADHINPVLSIDENFGDKQDSMSLKLNLSFSGEAWSAGIIEANGVFDLTLYRALTFSVYLPSDAPKGIEARAIIVSGDDFKWIEMGRSFVVEPGRKTVIKANLKNGCRDWRIKGEQIVLTEALKQDIRKVAIRIESNVVKYDGPIYLDDIQIEK